MVDWSQLKHELPPEMEKYLLMLTEALDARNELVLLGRLQKVLRLIYDEQVQPRRKGEMGLRE